MANNEQIILRAKFLNGAMALLAASPILHFCGLRLLERLDD